MIKIRKANIKDIKAINDIYNTVVKNLNATMDIKPKPLEEQKLWFKEYKENKLSVIVAELNDKVVGWASLSKWSLKEGYKYTVEDSIYVDNKYQGKGIGTKLLEQLIKKAKENDYKNLIAQISEGNESSVKLHKNHGFEKIGTLKKVGYKFNRFHDISIYQLEVR
ncbi:MAG: N-acetyltransferase family protein [Halanaerobiales bacterium]|nr:N-acetyltransferase family protein [Halanaerobiales bacterium]